MCGRYALHASPDVIALQFGLDFFVPQFAPRYNIAPTTEILVLRRDAAQLSRWGLIPAWAKDPAIGTKLINARGETVAEKPAFRQAFRRGRCLVPASGYYEWQAAGGKKHPWYFRPRRAALFGLAGLAERWVGPQGPLHTVCLITTTPNDLARRVHDRMPVIVAPQDYAAWLDPSTPAPQDLLRAFPDEEMEAYPVSRRVNTAREDSPELIEPLDSKA